MKKILCFGDISEKYKNAIEKAMQNCDDICGYEHAPENDEIPSTDNEIILMKCDIHSDDFLHHVITINKKQFNGEKFYLTHCAIFYDKSGNRQPFILTDAACIPNPDETQLTYIVQNAVSLYHRVFGDSRTPFISLISAGGDTNIKLSPMLHNWYKTHEAEFEPNTLRIEQLDVALDADARTEKHISGNLADIIVVDNINTGNAIFKSLSVLSGTWECACFLMGGKNLVVMNSRSANTPVITKNILMVCNN